MAQIRMLAVLMVIAMPNLVNKEKELSEIAKYWIGRIAVLHDGNYAKSDLAIENIERQFRMALAAILDDIEKWYNRFADENGLTYAQARKLLTTDELEEFRWTLEQYIDYARKHSTDPAWMRKLENASARAHVRRLEQIEWQIEAQIQMLTEGIQITIQDLLEEIYKAEYDGVKEILTKGAQMNMNVSYATLDDHAIKQVLEKPWARDELNFSDRIWSSRAKLIQSIDTAIPQGIIRGQSIEQMAAEVAKQTGNTRKNAERLVRKETAAISSEADKQLYKDLGIEEVRFMASLDAITCSVCGDMDLKVIPLRYSQTGVNMPPLHPNCRCYTVPVSDWGLESGERLAKESSGKYKKVSERTKFKEWKNERGTKSLASGKVGDKNGDSVIERIENFDYNDKKAIKERFNQFAEDHINSTNEHALVIAKSGKLYTLRGGSASVDISLIGDDELKDAIVIHNHPADIFDNPGDCFSRQDFSFMCEKGIAEMHLTNKVGYYEMTYDGPRLSVEEASNLYKEARIDMFQRFFIEGGAPEQEQLETVRTLTHKLKGLKLNEKSIK